MRIFIRVLFLQFADSLLRGNVHTAAVQNADDAMPGEYTTHKLRISSAVAGFAAENWVGTKSKRQKPLDWAPPKGVHAIKSNFIAASIQIDG